MPPLWLLEWALGKKIGLQTIIGEWAEKQFPQSTNDSICVHLKREVAELAKNHEPVEAADCLGLLLHFAHKNNFDLFDEAEKKHEINTQRKWGKPDKQNVVEHVK